LQERIPITENETAGELHDVMKEVGAQLLVKTIEAIANGDVHEQPQASVGDSAIKHAPKLFTETCTIDWTKSCNEIHNLVRGLSPFPGALTKLNDKILKIYSCTKEHTTPTIAQGSWSTDGKTFLKFACNDGYIHVTDMQMEGKKRMQVHDFLRGFRAPA
jgi:methionyl-tRNA formyltransferase